MQHIYYARIILGIIGYTNEYDAVVTECLTVLLEYFQSSSKN